MSSESGYQSILPTEFRVLHLLPGAFSEDIECILETRSWSVKTRYEALSYQWGDASITKAIRIAHLGTPARPGNTANVASLSVGRAIKVIQAWAARFEKPRQVLDWSLGTGLLWYWLTRLPFDVPSWAERWVSRDVYFLLLSMICGKAPWDISVKLYRLVTEIVRTKPWLLAYNHSPGVKRTLRTHGQCFEFEPVQVTENLALALRYLRRAKTPRTLWADALCINQKDEAEKEMQIQQMDRIYANSSPVLVWLGAYHGISDAQIFDGQSPASSCSPSSAETRGCKHKQEIQAAFRLIRALSGWRLMVPRQIYALDMDLVYREGLPGFLRLSNRGWWKRLWVVQEAALSTGRVLIQCGQYVCDLSDFSSAAHDKKVKHHCREQNPGSETIPSQTMLAVLKNFRYSSFYDQQSEQLKMGHKLTTTLFGAIFPDSKDDMVSKFQDKPFGNKLQQVLLRTAGHFQCHHEQDRLYAVLGISGGSQKGKTVAAVSSTIEYLSSQATQTVISHSLGPYMKAKGISTVTQFLVGFAMASWGIFYEERAKFWTFNRPDYVVNAYRDIISNITHHKDGGLRRSRSAFFAALAQYISRENKSLAFLDAANCGEDADPTMPSWAPNWTRKVSDEAFDFATRIKKPDEPPTTFHFHEDGKTLLLLGQPKGTVQTRPDDDNELKSSSSLMYRLLEHWLVLPNDFRGHLIKVLESFQRLMAETLPLELKSELEKMVPVMLAICLNIATASLEKGGRTLIFKHETEEGLELGFLKAGTARRGDHIVFVPDCFHCLILRPVRRNRITRAIVQWKLVGLMSRSTQFEEKEVVKKDEWTRLFRDGVVRRYSIQ